MYFEKKKDNFFNLRPIVIDRFKCELDSLVGQPFGYHYEIIDKKFKRKIISDETSDTNNGTGWFYESF